VSSTSGDDKPWQDEEKLRELYVEQGKTLSETGDILGCSMNTVSVWLKELGVGTRSISETKSQGAPDLLADKEKLRHAVIEQKKTPTQIGEEVGYSRRGVGKWIRKHEIELPHPCPQCERSFHTRQGVGQHHENEHDESIREYESRQGDVVCPWEGCEKAFGSQKAVESHYGLAHESGVEKVCEWCDGTYTKPPAIANGRRFCDEDCRNEWQETLVGTDSPHFRGGYDHYEAVLGGMRNEAWEKTAARVRERDDHTCQICGEERAPDDRALDVHHIIALVDGGCSADELLISLCGSCHHKTEAYTRSIPGVELHLRDWPDDELPEGRERWTSDDASERDGQTELATFADD